jgi:hypothetical protein
MILNKSQRNRSGNQKWTIQKTESIWYTGLELKTFICQICCCFRLLFFVVMCSAVILCSHVFGVILCSHVFGVILCSHVHILVQSFLSLILELRSCCSIYSFICSVLSTILSFCSFYLVYP